MPSLLVDLFTCLLNLTTSDLNSTITYVEYHEALIPHLGAAYVDRSAVNKALRNIPDQS